MDGILANSSVVDWNRGLLELKDGQLEAPDNIIKTASAARSLYARARTDNLKRVAQWAAIEGLIAGNPPYDQAELERHGLAYMANFNDLSARSRFEREGLAYWNLLYQTERLVSFSLDMEEPDKDNWAMTLSIEGDKVIREWQNFDTMMGTHTGQLSKLGLSVLVWSDERDWRPRTVELNRFIVPDQMSTNLDLMTFCFFENDFPAQDLFGYYQETKRKSKDSKDPYKHFWNLEALEKLLLFRANSIVKPNNEEFVDFMDLQRKIQNGDYFYNQLFGDGIRLISLLYKEYDGKISHYMFDSLAVDNAFVYFSDRQYFHFSQAISIFTVSPYEFTLHSNRGIGHKVFAPCQAKNQLACRAVDMAGFASTPMLRNQGGSVKDPAQIKLFPGVPTDIGSAEFVQNNLGANLQQVIGVLTYLDQNLSINLGMSGDDPMMPEGSNASVGSAQARLQRAPRATLLKNHIAHFCSQLDRVYRTIFSAMLRCKKGYPGYEQAEKWKRNCIRKGVPEKVFDLKDTEWGLPDWMSVKATRVGGDGSTEGMIFGLTDMLPIVPMFGPREQAAYKKDMVLATMGPDALSRYTQETDTQDEVSSGASDAGTENAIMQLGFSPIFSPTNDHQAHFGVHMSLNVDTMNKVQQQALDPIEAQKVFDISIPHTQEHWAALVKRAPFGEGFVKKWKKNFDQVIQYAALNRKNAIKMYEARIKKQQEAEANQQKVLTDEQLKELQLKADIDRRDRESQDKMGRQAKESETRAELKRVDVERKADNERLKIELQSRNQGVKNDREASLEENRQALADLTTVDLPGGEI